MSVIALERRLQKVEQRDARADRRYVVRLVDGQSTASAIAAHRTKTRYAGPVVIMPQVCPSIGEWRTRYAEVI